MNMVKLSTSNFNLQSYNHPVLLIIYNILIMKLTFMLFVPIFKVMSGTYRSIVASEDAVTIGE